MRTVAAALIAYFAALALHLPDAYWSVITVAIVMQSSLGSTLQAGLDRIVGTLAGAVVGAAAAWLHDTNALPVWLLLTLLLLVTSLAAGLRSSFRTAPIAGIIVMFVGQTTGIPPLIVALRRVAEIVLGCVVGILVAHFVLPSPARQQMHRGIARLLAVQGQQAEANLTGRPDAEIEALNRQGHALMAQLVADAGAEARERAARLSSGLSSDALLRTLRRVRSDIAFLGRAITVEGPPGASHARLADALRAFFAAASAWVDGHGSRPDFAEIDAELTAFPSPTPLGFAAEMLRRDLGELLDRLAEHRGEPASPPSPEG